MHPKIEKSKPATRRPSAHEPLDKQTGYGVAVQAESRPAAIAQRKLQDMADNSPQVQKIAQLQAIANHHLRTAQLQKVAQLTPIGAGGHGYRANGSSATFRSDHIAADEEGAKAATLGRNRNGRGTVNTVLLHTDQQIKNLVLATDWDDAVNMSGPVYRVKINCTYRIITAAQGADDSIIRSVGDETTGDVWVKVFFDETTQRISVTGVHGTG